MKKLLIAMTAAAIGTCAWATEGAGGDEGSTPATPTMLNETFGANWTLQAPWSYWSGAETATPAEGELTAGDALSLNTGSKVLRGNFMSDGSAKDIDTGLYFNATVTFKDPSDTLPTLGEADKFALVVLDNVESIDAEKATDPATNLMVIAKYGDGAQRAYELNVAVDSTWFDGEHEIVVKAYDNVMKSGSTACAGFLVMVDKTVCKVVKSYAIVDGVVDFGTYCAGGGYFGDDGLGGDGNLGYLGYAKDAIAASMQLRYQNAELLLSNVPGSDTLASVDFQGQGVIDDVSLATTGADFGADALVFTVEVSDGVTLTSDATVYYGAASETKNITFTLDEGFVLKAPTAAVKGDSGVYTYVYTTVADNNQVVKIEAYKPAAYIGDKAYETFTEALAAGGTIKLAQKVAENITIAGNKAIVLDLNGFDIEGSNASRATIVSEGNLTITNSVADKGSVVATAAGSVVNNGGVLNVQAGTFTGLVKVDGYNDEFGSANASVTVTGGTFDGAFTVVTPAEGAGYTVTATVTGGKFLKTANASVAGVTTGYEAKLDANETYWVVAEKVIVEEDVFEESKDLVDVEGSSATEAEINAALEDLATALGATADKDVAVTNYITQVCGGTVDADTLTAAKTAGTIGLSVAYDLPLMAAEPTVSEIEAEAATTDDAAAFSFKLMVGTDPVEIKKVTDKVRSMIEYGTSLNGMNALTPQDTGVALEVDATSKKIKVKLLKTGGNAGFMKVKLNK